MLTRQSPVKMDQHARIHIVPNRLCNGKVLLKGPPSNQQVTCTLRYTTTTTRSCWGSGRRTQKNCKQCKNDFCHRLRVVPHDLVFEHKERSYFPLNGDWKNHQVSNREATRYYHADYNCMKARFPYITNDYIEIPPDVRAILHESHKAHPREQFLLDL